MLLTVVRARPLRSWITIVLVVLCVAGVVDGCGGQRSTGTRSQAPTSARVVTARTYYAQVSTVCRRYNAEIAQIGRMARGSREHEAQLARATNVVTASEARRLMQIPRPPGFGRLERLYREMRLAASAAEESAQLFAVGQQVRANEASLSASHEIGAVNGAFRRLGLSICAE
jgi:hypothetical protein